MYYCLVLTYMCGVIDCNEWKTEKRYECANNGKVKRLKLWWQLYRTSLPEREGPVSSNSKRDYPAATSRRTRELGTSRRASQSQHIKNGQPAPILQVVIRRQQPKGIGLSVTIQKGVTSFDTQHDDTERAHRGLPCCPLTSLHQPD